VKVTGIGDKLVGLLEVVVIFTVGGVPSNVLVSRLEAMLPFAAASTAELAATLTVTAPSAAGVMFAVYTLLFPAKLPTLPLVTMMSPAVNPVTFSLKVIVIGKGERFVGSVDVEVIVVVGATLSNVKPVREAVPPAVVTTTLPVLPPATIAEICVLLSTLKEAAGVPPKLTAVAPVRLVPVIITVAPVVAVVGVNEDMVGAGMKVNPAKTAVPPGVVTETFPEAPFATTAVIVLPSTTLNEAALVPPKLTAVAPVKLDPEMVIVAPIPAVVGLNEEITGGGITVKLELEVTVAPFEVTLIGPVVAPAGTTVFILLPFPVIEVIVADTLLKNFTEVT